MDIKEYNNFYHVDISTQIDNKWKNDSILGIVKDSRKYSIKIKGRDKEEIKKRFVIKDDSRSAKRHNLRVVICLYCYLLYKALCEFQEAKPLLLCRDVRPEILIMNYLRKIAKFFNNKETMNREIKFRKKIEFETNDKLPKSLAGKHVRKVFKGKINPDKILDSKEIKEVMEVISKLL